MLKSTDIWQRVDIDLVTDNSVKDRVLALALEWSMLGDGDVIQMNSGEDTVVETGHMEIAIGFTLRDKHFPFMLSEAKHVLKLMTDSYEECRAQDASFTKPDIMQAFEMAIEKCGAVN